MEKKKYLECGKIVNTHGVKGAVKLESWCNSPYDLAEKAQASAQKLTLFRLLEISLKAALDRCKEGKEPSVITARNRRKR